MIEPIGEWVLKTACEQIKAWQAAGLPKIRIGVNLSARQFRQPQLVKRIQNILLETGLDATWLELEITETMIMQDPKNTEKILKELHAMGISIVIDDFGTGGASVNYLKRFPINSLKIDRSLIQDIPGDQEKVSITKALISMAKTLKFRIIAEGVETKEQNDFLLAEGCDEFQGYIFSEPCTAEDFEKLLKNTVKKQKVLS
jgi:EAL domain-containing protein (putative c-di-GMP-specific phosphodiesterase class I)